MLEKDIQKRIKDKAYQRHGRIDLEKKTGLLLIKKLSTLAMYGEAGWPDMEISIRQANKSSIAATIYLEVKKPGGEVTDLQFRRHEELRALGFPVHVVDDVGTGVRIIDQAVAKYAYKTRPGRPLQSGFNREP